MLASLLPGVRLIRAPLVAGALLLANLYVLAVHWGSFSLEADGGEGLDRLLDVIGDGWIVVASIFAYLLGSLYLGVHTHLIRNLNDVMIEHVATPKYTDPDHEQTMWEEVLAPFSRPSLRRLAGRGDRPWGDVRKICADIIFGGGRRLLVANKELYVEYDRLRSEAQFRDACTLPGLALLLTLTWESSLGGAVQVVITLVGALLGVLLFREARRHDREAASLHAHAVADSTVTTAFIDDPKNSGRGRRRGRRRADRDCEADPNVDDPPGESE